MNIFDNYKATQFFIATLDAIDPARQSEWSKLVKDKFQEKVQSDVELENYKITLADLQDLRTQFFSSEIHG